MSYPSTQAHDKSTPQSTPSLITKQGGTDSTTARQVLTSPKANADPSGGARAVGSGGACDSGRQHAASQERQVTTPAPTETSTGSNERSVTLAASILPSEPLDFDINADPFNTAFEERVDSVQQASTGSISDIESLLETSSGLGWGDLFAPSWDFSMSPLANQSYSDPLSMLAYAANQPAGMMNDPQQFLYPLPTDQSYQFGDIGPPPYISHELQERDVLEDGKLLLKHFREVVVPQFAPLPMVTKSPWEKLIWAAAVQTHADMTYLASHKIKHASKANLFAVLGCSAHSISKTGCFENVLPSEKATQILEYARSRAKRHMQESLKSEISGPQKAKYKDQLMAILSLIALATLGGNQTDARCYLLDAERLLRLRGLAKRELSRRARLLHHVYTWLRIIGESTYTLHDHAGQELKQRIEKSFHRPRTSVAQASDRDPVHEASERAAQLDDFLRIEAHNTDSDSDQEAAKEREIGLRDIHLEDLREWNSTLYMDVYGIPEAWLSLVSQTTRLANIVDFIEQSSVQPPRAFAGAIQRKIIKLEQMVCSFSAQHCSSRSPSPPQGGTGSGSRSARRTAAGKEMLRAMGSALVLFFYRRIRKSHSWMLQGHIDDVINALKKFDNAQDDDSIKTPGTPWPAFIAGCEATSAESREWLMSWMRKGESQSAFNGFTSSQWVMQEVWKSRDDANAGISAITSGTKASRDMFTQPQSWVEVLQQHKFWLMIY